MANDNSMIRFYSLASYDRGAKARWLLTELGIAFETRMLDRKEKENDSPEFLRLNPMGRVPVMEIGDTAVFESGAICAYLADRYLDRGLAPGLSSPDRAKYLQWMYFSDSTLDQIQTRIMIIEDIPPGEVQIGKETRLLSDFHDALTAIDQDLIRNDYLVANRFSAADISVSYHLYWCAMWPELNGVLFKFPRVATYVERMKKMPSAVKANVFSFEP